MRTLNQALLEGTIAGKPEYISQADLKSCIAEIEVEKLTGETFKMKIAGYGLVADIMNRKLQDKSKVRIIGRLDFKEGLGICLILEHIEFRK